MRRRGWALALLLLAAAAGAQPVPNPGTPPVGQRVALVLGGGAARGIAHVGVLRTLTAAGVPIDMIVGTSMGSLIGGLYAAGFDAATLAEVVVEVDPSGAAELLLPPRGGILDGMPLSMLLDGLLEGRRLDQVVVPFVPVVTDLYSGEPQRSPPGPLADAIRASSAIPVLFDPVEIAGRFYYDGGLKQTLPTLLARELGATYVIAVDVGSDAPFDPTSVGANLARIVTGLVDTFTADDIAVTDVRLDPGLRDRTYMDFDLSADFVRAGERVALDALPQILADLERLGIPLRPPGDPNVGAAINEGWRERLEAARRRVEVRDRPWNLGFDVAFAPTATERVTAAPAPVGSRLRFGVDLRDGPLGHGSVGASYARSVAGGSDALQLRASYRLGYGWALLGRADHDVGGSWTFHARLRWLATPRITVEVGVRWPAPALESLVRWRSAGLWLDGVTSVGLDDPWARVHLDARGAVGFDEPELAGWALRGRVFLGGTSGGAPTAEHFSVGPAIGLRGTPPDAWTAPAVAVGSLEVATAVGPSRAVLGTARLTPSTWLFADTAWFDDGGTLRSVWALGLGAGVEGRLFGFVPFALGFDLGYGLTAGTWYLGWRFGPAYPDPVRY